MPSVHTVQEEGSGEPSSCLQILWAQEEPGTAHPAHVLPAVSVILQVQPPVTDMACVSFELVAQKKMLLQVTVVLLSPV